MNNIKSTQAFIKHKLQNNCNLKQLIRNITILLAILFQECDINQVLGVCTNKATIFRHLEETTTPICQINNTDNRYSMYSTVAELNSVFFDIWCVGRLTKGALKVNNDAGDFKDE